MVPFAAPVWRGGLTFLLTRVGRPTWRRQVAILWYLSDLRDNKSDIRVGRR